MAKRMVKKKYLILGCSILGILLCAGIIWATIHFNVLGKIMGSSKNDITEKEDEEKEPVEEIKKLKIVDENSSSRPYAVMINNIAAARPYQSGLQDAYIIYELIAEGGITRYLALFKDQNTQRIASVRSARHYYLDYVLENDAYFVHWGWSPQAQSDISKLKIDNINGLAYEGTYFKRDNTLDVAIEHRGYTSMEMLNKAVDRLKYRKETNKDLLLNYSIEEINMAEIENSKVANKVDITYSNSTTSSYEYDSEEKVYYRSVNGKKQIDYVTKKQYYFKNIITYQVGNKTISGDDKGRQDLDNIGSGTGYYISGGYAIPIKWEKTSRSSQTKYYYENGDELVVNDGNTFIQIQPKNLKLQIS